MADTPLLRVMREQRGLSLREVSRRSGINPGRLSIIERGVAPTPDEVKAILAAMELAQQGAA